MRNFVVPALIFFLVVPLAAGCGPENTQKTKIEQYKRIVDDQGGRIVALETENDGLDGQIEILQIEYNRLQAENTAIKEAFDKFRNMTEQERAEWLDKMDEMKERVNEKLAALQKELEAAEFDEGVEVDPTPTGVKLTILGDVLFDSGKDIIKEGGQKALVKVAGVLAGLDGVIRVDGHTDSDPVKASKARFPLGNWQLGGMRALRVLLFLEANGVSEDKMFFSSFGEFMPRDSNESKEGKARNRRVEIIFIDKDFLPVAIPDGE